MKVFDSVITSRGNRVKATLSHLFLCFGADIPILLTDDQSRSVEGYIYGITKVHNPSFDPFELYDVTINVHRPNKETVRVHCY